MNKWMLRLAFAFLGAMVNSTPAFTSSPAIANTVSLPPGVTVAKVAVNPHDVSNIFAATSHSQSSLYVSHDGGLSWATLSAVGLDCIEIRCNSIAIDPAIPGHLIVSSDVGLHYSNDGGLTWAIAWPARAMGYVGFDPFRKRAFAVNVVDRSLLQSDDGGASWTLIGFAPPDSVVDLVFSSSLTDRLILVSDTVNYQSDDGGQSWRVTNELLAVGELNSSVSAQTADLVLTGEGNVYVLGLAFVWFTITNSGAAPAMNTVVVVQLPAAPSVRSVYIDSPGRRSECVLGTLQAVCNFGSFGSGQSARINVDFNPGPGGRNYVTGTAISDTLDANPADNSITVYALGLPIQPVSPPAPSPPAETSSGGGSMDFRFISVSLTLLIIMIRLKSEGRRRMRKHNGHPS